MVKMKMTSIVLVGVVFTFVMIIQFLFCETSLQIGSKDVIRFYGNSGRSRSSSGRSSSQRTSGRYNSKSSRSSRRGGGGGGGGGGYVFIPDERSSSSSGGLNPKTIFLGLKVLILKIILLLTKKEGGSTNFLSGLMPGMGSGGDIDTALLAGMMPSLGGNNGLG